jgi:hypothetical protein
MKPLLISRLALICSPAITQVSSTFPLSIPQECFELARREGVPTLIYNKYQAAIYNKISSGKSAAEIGFAQRACP